MSRPAPQVRAFDDPKVEPMLHVQNTRASRRAIAAASAHSAIRAKRPFLFLTGAIGALVGVTLAVGAVSAPAAGDEGSPAPGAVSGGLVPTVEISGESAEVLEAAQAAVTAAETLNAEVAASGLDLGVVPASVDPAPVQAEVATLTERTSLPALLLPALTADAADVTADLTVQTETLRTALTTAQQQKAADDAARAAAEKAAAEEAALASLNTTDGAKAAARDMAASRYGWGSDQFSCLESLWSKESGWDYQAYNDSSGATGIPQALPGSKMASAGGDWQTNAATQIAWGLGYISSVYGTPCSAWSHSQATDWY